MRFYNHFFKFIRVVLVGCLISFWAFELGLAGTTGKISGVIKDIDTGEVLPGVNVIIDGTSMGAATNAEGVYFILNIPPGLYTVKAVMMGYTTVIKEKVRINADRTAFLNFDLKTKVLEADKEVVITAERPLVELDISASQTITTAEQAAVLPATEVLQTLAYEPGVTIDNLEEVKIRGGGNDQISFQVDGMERMDRLNTRAYTSINSATISEVQILTGGFNAEYGNIRSGIFNVVTKDGGPAISGSIDYRSAPAQEKHFGPNAYGTDQYDYKLYASPESFNEIKDVEGNLLWQGWEKRTQTLNAANYLGKNNWKPEEVLEIWKWQHRARDYANKADHYLDAGIGGPLKFLEELGLKEAGYFAGYKFTRYLPPFAILTNYFQSDVKELKINFKPHSSVKVILSGMYGRTHTTTTGTSWSENDWTMSLVHGGENVVTTATGRNKYYLDSDCILDLWNRQVGAKIIHTLSPSTYYELKYNRYWADTEVGRGASRSPLSFGVKNISGIWFDQTPWGWVDESEKEPDLTGAYDMGGGGKVKDTSNVVTQKINLDLTSQITSKHLVKAGLEYEFSHLKRKYASIEEIQLLYGEWVEFDEKPRRFAAYVQDKIEFGGMIANVGLRFDYFAANGKIWEPDNIYSTVFARGGTEGKTVNDIPSKASETYWYISPRLGVAHPVREHTKFFFNYGIFYSEPPASSRYGYYSEHRPFGDPQGDVRWVGYADLKPPRTIQYEVGFEQSLWDTYLIRASFYAKDNEDQIGNLRIDGVAGTHNTGTFVNFVSVGKGAAGYDTPRNNQYEDIRGIEIKVSKVRGRFFTGWLNFDYNILTRGYYGNQRLNQDPLIGYYIYSAVQERPEPVPGFIGNVDFHTPSDWGLLKGDWRINLVQHWDIGQKVIWNPENLPTREVRSVYHWVDTYVTDVRFTKTLKLGDSNFHLYLDLTNLFNFKKLNWSALNTTERESYINNVVDPNNGLGNDIGDWKDKNEKDVFTENWTDKSGTIRAPIAPSKDFALFLYPRAYLLGVKLEF